MASRQRFGATLVLFSDAPRVPSAPTHRPNSPASFPLHAAPPGAELGFAMNSRRTLALILCLASVPVALARDASQPFPWPTPAVSEKSGFAHALQLAEGALKRGDLASARDQIRRAQERDPNAISAWELRVRWAQAMGDEDEEVYCLHRQLALSEAQGRPKSELKDLREKVLEIDPFAAAAFDLRERFVERLADLGEKYEKEGRPHSAIRAHKQALALDPENTASIAAIERIAAAPDPSLAEDAKPRDLLADVSAEWIDEHDKEHDRWGERAILKRENYETHTDAGYEVLVRAAEAMEQMNAFYRQFFRYGTEEDGGSVPRIQLNIFKDRDEYLKLGIGPPVEWSAGHFTGNAVETYIGQGGFEETTGTLFHEAAHQFVSLATNASGWLNEGLASFFEGCRILSNGTVLMNLPANHRLFPLVTRMEAGWMVDENDGMNPDDLSGSTPTKAPTFRIVLENKYPWGPPWYAPTWGVVYFLYNYQDPWDGRFVYRHAFQEFINTSGGRVGDGAVRNFEEVVLANPAPPTKGVERPEDAPAVDLPRTVEELDAVWKDYLVRLRDEQSGRLEVQRPYRRWAEFATMRGDFLDAKEHFEKGIVAHPNDPDLHQEFAELLADELGESDRATKLYLRAASLLEQAEDVDSSRLADLEREINKLDPHYKTLARVRTEIAAASRKLVSNYQASDRHLMAMDMSWRLGNDLQLPELFEEFEESVRASGKTLAMWRLAYNEENLEGWSAATVPDSGFKADGVNLRAEFGQRVEGDFSYRLATLDKVTSGDFSVEAEIQADRTDVSFAGLVFGRKSATDFHAFALFPPGKDKGGEPRSGFVDLVSFYGSGSFDTWRHEPVPADTSGGSSSERWYRLRVDVIGNTVDVWFDGEYVTSKEFASVDVLRGSFGLLVGTGKARFRNVRYLTRVARDPGAAIERSIRLESLSKPGESVNGSWLGQGPPFPQVARWIQGERKSWAEARDRPQLLVLFSIDQNEVIRLDPWLAYLDETYGQIGLEIISIALSRDSGRLETYLAQHEFPGSVGIDAAGGSDPLGKTFGDYSIAKFNLPRLVLLDVDGTVAWEGDPGFVRGKAFDASEPSYLKGPLEELISKRKLKAVSAWRTTWLKIGPAALEAGDLASILPLLEEARDLEASGESNVMQAARALRAATLAIENMEGTLARMEGYEPAVTTLLEWAELLQVDPSRSAKKGIRDAKKTASYKDWIRLKKVLKRFSPAKLEGQSGEEFEASKSALLEGLGRLEGPLVRDLEREVQDSFDADDLAFAIRSSREAPARWLAALLFR